MKAKYVVITVAVVLSSCFGGIYLKFFSNIEDKMDIYICQVGIYKEQENADAMKEKLTSLEFKGYSYTKEDTIVVVSEIFTNEKEANELGTKISELGMTCVVKEYEVDDELKTDIEENKYDAVFKEIIS